MAKIPETRFKEAYAEAVQVGNDINFLAETLGISKKSVRRYCKIYDLPLSPLNKHKGVDPENFLAAYRQVKSAGGDMKELAAKLGCKEQTAKKYCRVCDVAPLRKKSSGNNRSGLGRPRGFVTKAYRHGNL